ncbi:LysR family transcriptional regulator [Cryobacterium sp. HLT2-28]|uniref:LysR family transcriptional regulator n=1 Tax=Cryobacterium sp. HLT2-28 TaxID=1259146 RepID=UPI001F540359|nr:LysR family transcriptional regulator [Cryobacterium sp. HLT2-28]
MTLTRPEALDLDSQALRVVQRIAELGSITAAARSLGYSQPAVSQQLKRLEARIGMPVVSRVGRGVRLTEAGRILSRYAVSVTTALDAAAGELGELAGLRSGRVRLASFPSASSTIVPTLLRELATVHPGLQLSYREAEPPEAVQFVRDQAADLAITFSYPGDPGDPHRSSARGLAVLPLWRDEMLVVHPGRASARDPHRGRPGRPRGGELDRRLPPLPGAPACPCGAARVSAPHRPRDR